MENMYFYISLYKKPRHCFVAQQWMPEPFEATKITGFRWATDIDV
jgi:hypothetical protein